MTPPDRVRDALETLFRELTDCRAWQADLVAETARAANRQKALADSVRHVIEALPPAARPAPGGTPLPPAGDHPHPKARPRPPDRAHPHGPHLDGRPRKRRLPRRRPRRPPPPDRPRGQTRLCPDPAEQVQTPRHRSGDQPREVPGVPGTSGAAGLRGGIVLQPGVRVASRKDLERGTIRHPRQMTMIRAGFVLRPDSPKICGRTDRLGDCA